MLLIMGVDVCVGPLLTLVAFNPKKTRRHLAIDLSVIAALQAIAFGYGFSVIVAARPVFIVAEVDRLILVSANELDDADLADGSAPEYRRRSWNGPVLVAAVPPRGEEALAGTISALHGKDINLQPKYYRPYDEAADSLMQHAQPIESLRQLDEAQRTRLQQAVARATAQGTAPKFLPLRSRTEFFTALMSPTSRQPVAVLAIDPWP
jgi:hypothetical protein